MAKDELRPKPSKINTPYEELVLMANFKDTVFFDVMKRWARRYAEQTKNAMFRLSPNDPKLDIKMAQYKHEVIGIEVMLKTINEAPSELEKRQNGGI